MNDTSNIPPIVDPRGQPSDIAITVIACACSLAVWITCIPAIYFSSLKPLRTKQANLVITSGIFGSILMLSSIATNAHYNVEFGTFWGTCSFWVLWFAIVLGIGPWTMALLTRPFRLVLILMFQKVIDGKKTALIMASLEAPWVIYAIIAQVFAAENMYRTDKRICANGGTAWSIALFAIIGVYIVFYLVLTFLLWRIKNDKAKAGYVNLLFEWPVIRTGAIAITFMLVTNAVIWAVKQFYDVDETVKMVTRFFLTLTTLIAVCFFFFVPISEPLWNLLFKRDQYMKSFEETASQTRMASVRSGVSRTDSVGEEKTPRGSISAPSEAGFET